LRSIAASTIAAARLLGADDYATNPSARGGRWRGSRPLRARSGRKRRLTLADGTTLRCVELPKPRGASVNGSSDTRMESRTIRFFSPRCETEEQCARQVRRSSRRCHCHQTLCETTVSFGSCRSGGRFIQATQIRCPNPRRANASGFSCWVVSLTRRTANLDVGHVFSIALAWCRKPNGDESLLP